MSLILRNIALLVVMPVFIGGVFLLVYQTEKIGDSQQPSAKFGGVSLSMEFATTEAAREQGLGGRTSIPDNYGMLFVFPEDDLYGFWMKDMLVPIDIFWLDSKGQVVTIATNVATSTYPNVFYPTVPSRYVLETAAGFARTYTIATGTPLLLKTFPIVSK